MLSKLRSLRPSHATVVAYAALFVALGGTSYAVTQINGGTLKNRTVAGRKLKKNTVTGTEVNEGTLGSVPRAFISATALNANQLGGQPPAAYKAQCPAGMRSAAGLCFDSADRASANWLTALKACSTEGARLPTVAELALVFEHLGAPQTSQWTSDRFDNGGPYADSVSDDSSRQLTVSSFSTASVGPYLCVASPSE